MKLVATGLQHCYSTLCRARSNMRRFRLPMACLIIGIFAWNFTSLPSAAGQQVVSVSASSPLAQSITLAVVEGADAKKGINFFYLMTQGGWFMLPLMLLSIAVGAIAVERFLALRRDRIFPVEMIDQLSSLSKSPVGLDPRRAYQICQQFPSSAAYVLRSMLVKVGRPQPELEHAVSESSQREATRLAQTTSWLSLAAGVAPLIGLLGTVWGITQAFYDTTQLAELNAGQNRGIALANGIYVALVTTMFGLMIAIPAAVLGHFYENRIVKLMNEIEEMAFNLLPQFERYEGQVRFTQGVAESETDKKNDTADAQHPATSP